MLGAQCTSHRRHNRSQMKNKIYHYGSFSRNFYLSVVKVKVPHPGIKLQMPHTYGRLFKRLCCSFSLMTMGKMLMELFMILLSCLERNLCPPPPSPCIPSSYFWNEAKLVYRALDDHFIKVTTVEELSWLRRPRIFSTIILCGVLSEVQLYYRIYCLHAWSDEAGRRNKSS